MSGHLPPLNPLRVFVVVARTRNLTAAASELNVSQSNVSRQIGVLESYLGVRLFTRERLGVILTTAGADFAKAVTPAFETIGRATAKLTRGDDEKVLRVRAYTTFTAKWLIPRLSDFKRLHPDLEIVISNAVPQVDFSRDPVDVAIQFGDGRWPGVAADLLFKDEIEPVCAPGYLNAKESRPDAQSALQNGVLLVARYRRADWQDWLEAIGQDRYRVTTQRMIFGSSLLAWQAAIDGLGMAIGQPNLLQADLDAGRLIRPFAQPLNRAGNGHYLVRSDMRRYSAKSEHFRDWILSTSGASR
ncbi:MAG: LysR substrate-binding domain-containing protein [Burkholderiaceae bacterium]|nr:LysR substrate-binding domain-containing protein [Burkholderiaceae bacterium]